MEKFKQPDKYQVRDWLDERRRTGCPLPDMAQIQRAVGWRSDTPDVNPEPGVARGIVVPG